ncbi:MAG: hypothetical protein ACP5K1_06290 [Candidatus Bathyarchaeia archaeon]
MACEASTRQLQTNLDKASALGLTGRMRGYFLSLFYNSFSGVMGCRFGGLSRWRFVQPP